MKHAAAERASHRAELTTDVELATASGHEPARDLQVPSEHVLHRLDPFRLFHHEHALGHERLEPTAEYRRTLAEMGEHVARVDDVGGCVRQRRRRHVGVHERRAGRPGVATRFGQEHLRAIEADHVRVTADLGQEPRRMARSAADVEDAAARACGQTRE